VSLRPRIQSFIDIFAGMIANIFEQDEACSVLEPEIARPTCRWRGRKVMIRNGHAKLS
jgi:hypothetical protein